MYGSRLNAYLGSEAAQGKVTGAYDATIWLPDNGFVHVHYMVRNRPDVTSK